MPAIESFDEDAHAASNGYGERTEAAPTLRAADPPTRCIEHSLMACAECDGASGRRVEAETMKRAASRYD